MCEANTYKQNSFKILAKQYTDAEIQDALEDIRKHFMDVYNNKEYLKFEQDVLKNILLSDDLNVENEEIVFETIKKWLEDKKLNPEKHLHILIDVVRLHFLPLEYFWNQVEAYALSDDKCFPIFLDIIKYHLLPNKRSEMNFKNIKERNSYKKFLSIGTWTEDTSGIIELYDSSLNKWTYLKTIDLKRTDFVAVIVKNTIMILGGHNKKALNNVDIIDLETGRLTAGQPMKEPRCYASALVVGEINPVVYVIGSGSDDDDGALSSCEKWDSVKSEWTLLPAMSVKRKFCGSAYLDGKIYVAGGKTSKTVHSSMESYDIKSNLWEMKASMNQIRKYCRIVASKTYVYAMGGYTNEYSNLVERYDPKLNSWTNMANMKSKGLVGLCSYGTFQNKILVVGGNGPSKITQEYDEDKNMWKDLAQLNIGQYAPIVLEIPKHMHLC